MWACIARNAAASLYDVHAQAKGKQETSSRKQRPQVIQYMTGNVISKVP